MADHSAPTRNLPALTGLRGVASVWVVFYHTLKHVPVVASGYAGVDIFFVLSGFVLSHVYLRDSTLGNAKGYATFLGARLARIYPLHLFSLLFLLGVLLVLPHFAQRYPDPVARFSSGAFFASLLLIQNWAHWRINCWNTPAWSLSAEWLAYLCFPFLLVMLRKLRASIAVTLALAFFALSSAIGLLFLSGDHMLSGTTGRNGLVRMAGEFVAGCFIYLAYLRGWRMPQIVGLTLLIVLLAVGMAGNKTPLSFALVLAAVPVVLMAAQEGNLFSKFLETKPIIFLGEISFSIYMMHWIVIQIFNWLSDHGMVWNWFLLKTVTLLTVLGLSIGTYQFIELPARKWGRYLARVPRPIPVEAATG